jgi:hypothetical protein
MVLNSEYGAILDKILITTIMEGDKTTKYINTVQDKVFQYISKFHLV